MAVQTWDPSHNNSSNTLSNGNLTATSNASVNTEALCYGLVSKTSGKYYWETTVTGLAGHVGVGLGNTLSSTSTGNYLGWANDQIGHFSTGEIDYNNFTWATVQSWISGTTVCHALDLDNLQYWVRAGINANWNNSGANNPATNTGGFAISGSGVPAQPVVPALGTFNNTTPDSVVAAFASGSWAGTAPSGFGPWTVTVAVPPRLPLIGVGNAIALAGAAELARGIRRNAIMTRRGLIKPWEWRKE